MNSIFLRFFRMIWLSNMPIFHPLCGILLTTRGTRWCCLQQFRPLLFSIRLIKKIDLVVAYIVCSVSRPWTKDQALLCIIVFSIPLYHRINTISNGTIGLELGIVWGIVQHIKQIDLKKPRNWKSLVDKMMGEIIPVNCYTLSEFWWRV